MSGSACKDLEWHADGGAVQLEVEAHRLPHRRKRHEGTHDTAQQRRGLSLPCIAASSSPPDRTMSRTEVSTPHTLRHRVSLASAPAAATAAAPSAAAVPCSPPAPRAPLSAATIALCGAATAAERLARSSTQGASILSSSATRKLIVTCRAASVSPTAAAWHRQCARVAGLPPTAWSRSADSAPPHKRARACHPGLSCFVSSGRRAARAAGQRIVDRVDLLPRARDRTE